MLYTGCHLSFLVKSGSARPEGKEKGGGDDEWEVSEILAHFCRAQALKPPKTEASDRQSPEGHPPPLTLGHQGLLGAGVHRAIDAVTLAHVLELEGRDTLPLAEAAGGELLRPRAHELWRRRKARRDRRGGGLWGTEDSDSTAHRGSDEPMQSTSRCDGGPPTS